MVGSNTNTYNGKMTVYVILTSLMAASGGLLFGYDIGITGVTSMSDFLHKFFPNVLKEQAHAKSNAYYKFDDQLLQLFTSSLFIAALFGSLLASITTTRWGRVRTMLISGLFFCAGALLTALHQFWLSLSLDGSDWDWELAVPLFLSEMAPANLRGALNQLFQLATTIRILVAQLINYGTQNAHPWGWRLSLGLAGVSAILLTIGGLTLPETPNSLIERGRLGQGRINLERTRGTKDVEAEFNDIVSASEKVKQSARPFLTIFRKDYRPQLVFAFLIPFFQQVTGINAIMFYAAFITGAVNVVATGVSIALVDRAGRKKLFLAGGIQMLLMQVAIGITLGLTFGAGKKQLSSEVSTPVIQPLATRSAGQSITVATNFLFTFVIGQAFLLMLCGTRFGIFLFFAFWVLVVTGTVQLFLPETKGMPIEEMELIRDTHWFWKRYFTARPAPASNCVERTLPAQSAAVP
eukprot:jgi/Mesen1/10612/ME000088S10110